MPRHHYESLPTSSDDAPLNPLNRSYFTGLPSTAPPSFHSIALSLATLPHRIDEIAAKIRPPQIPSQAQDAASDGGISLYPSTNSESDIDLEAAREDTIARLMGRIELLERRVEVQETKVQPYNAHAELAKMGPWKTAAVGLWIIILVAVSLYFAIPRTVQAS